MTLTNVISLDVKTNPWKHESEEHKPIVEEVQLVCVVEVYVTIDHVEEEVYFRRTDTHDELWTMIPIASPEQRRSVTRQIRAGTPEVAAERLLKRVLRSKAGFEWPSNFIRAGLISRDRFYRILDELEKGFKRNAEVTRNNEAPIVSKARALKLDPIPSHTEVGIWKAWCRKRHFGLQLNNKTNSFYCGYCKRGGDEQALIEFVRGDKS